MLNEICLMGRLTANPELKKTQSGVEVCSITLACDRDVKDSNGNKGCDFIDVVIWRGKAKFFCDWFHKGDLAIVRGRLQSRKWTDKNGQNRTYWEVQADEVYFGNTKKDTANTYDEADATPVPQMAEVEEYGELPFE